MTKDEKLECLDFIIQQIRDSDETEYICNEYERHLINHSAIFNSIYDINNLESVMRKDFPELLEMINTVGRKLSISGKSYPYSFGDSWDIVKYRAAARSKYRIDKLEKLKKSI